MNDKEKWEFYDNKLLPKIKNCVNKLNGNMNLWYEVWIDLDESFDRFGSYVFDFPNLAAYNLARWIIKRDRWYWGPDYIKELEASTKELGSLELALCSVSDKSLNFKKK